MASRAFGVLAVFPATASSRRPRSGTCSRSGSRVSNLRCRSTSSRTGASRPVTSNRKTTSFDLRSQKDGTAMSTKIASDRKMRVEEILAAFGIKAGGTVTGVAYGGAFHDDASGPLVETRDPSTGDVLAHVRTASPDDCRRAGTQAHETFSPLREGAAPPPGAIRRPPRGGVFVRQEKTGTVLSPAERQIPSAGPRQGAEDI